MLELARERGAGKSLCPSEVARQVAGDDGRDWRSSMEPARCAARRLAREGKIVILQGGKAIDPDNLKGPIRVALK